jgi:hypothetical protein
LDYLFDLLPDGAERAITDDRFSLIRAIVRVGNRYAHGKFEEAAASIERIHTLSVKVAALLSFAEGTHEGFPNEVIEMAKRIRVLVVGAGGTGSAIVMGLPYLDHQAMRAWRRGSGLDVWMMDADPVSETNCSASQDLFRQTSYHTDCRPSRLETRDCSGA